VIAPSRPPAAAEYEWTSLAPEAARQPALRVVGIGGGGVNAVNRMIEAEVTGVEFIALNTDAQSLNQSAAHVTLQIGADITRGLGSGANPDLGRSAAMEDHDRIKTLLKGSDMVFITAGEGGGTGTGAAPVIARVARELGALAVGIVTKPFGFEGSRRMKAAEEGIAALGERSTPSSSSRTTACCRCSTSRPRWWRRSASPTTSCARACRASRTSSRCPA
jgi:cell division protein FtsZ